MTAVPPSNGRVIDHVVIVVADLPAARRALTALGFSTTERGGHPRFGTSNHLAMLEDSYVELISLDESSAETDYMRAFLTRGGGLCGIALACLDATADAARLMARGIEVTPPVEFERPVATPAGDRIARFRTTRLITPTGFDAYLFYCEHRTPELVWVEPRAQHSNGATRIVEVELPATLPYALPLALLVPGASGGAAMRAGRERRLAILVRELPSDFALRTAGFQAERAASRLEARHAALGDITVELRIDTRD